MSEKPYAGLPEKAAREVEVLKAYEKGTSMTGH